MAIVLTPIYKYGSVMGFLRSRNGINVFLVGLLFVYEESSKERIKMKKMPIYKYGSVMGFLRSWNGINVFLVGLLSVYEEYSKERIKMKKMPIPNCTAAALKTRLYLSYGAGNGPRSSPCGCQTKVEMSPLGVVVGCSGASAEAPEQGAGAGLGRQAREAGGRPSSDHGAGLPCRSSRIGGPRPSTHGRPICVSASPTTSYTIPVGSRWRAASSWTRSTVISRTIRSRWTT